MTTTRYSETQDTPFPSAPRPIPTCPFGRDAIELPVLGLGGQSLIQRCPDDDAPVEMIRRALDLGVRYIDTAPLYGPSERRVGIAIKGRRSEVFIATKTGYRRGSSARRSLERSLKLLGTDYVDLFQLHCFFHQSEIGTVFGRGGVMRMLEKAREEGLVRRIGITGHYSPSVLAEILRRYPFDSVLIPVNPADGVGDSFLDTTLPAARETGASVVAMKVMGAGYLTHKRQNPTHLLHWALSQPVSLAIVSCRSIRDLEANVEAAVHFQPMDAARMREMETGEPELMQHCARIYKRYGGVRGTRIAVRNWLAAQAARLLPGWWHC